MKSSPAGDTVIIDLMKIDSGSGSVFMTRMALNGDFQNSVKVVSALLLPFLFR